MGKLVLVTGGARSGKSTFAENFVRTYGKNILYIATAIAFDEEMKERVHLHRLQRPSTWETLEAFRNFGNSLPGLLIGRDAAMLDCITNMVSNIMLQKDMEWNNMTTADINEVEREVSRQISELLSVIKDADIPFVIVTNELGMGVVPSTVLGRAARDIAGRTNQKLAREAEEVHLLVSGIPIRIK
ncbi:MAG TPA: bifunctional adenosylcobinamide kinase/adenosylcobinamide-phosphate guanylyltransferase [Clostridia bacterium]|nr:bifunctional adenosylcobinamide kinase/adenosylcobinamide-phosphate guanylyltransferase [Clostridia bacterium]